jgi:hypothetical protein
VVVGAVAAAGVSLVAVVAVVMALLAVADAVASHAAEQQAAQTKPSIHETTTAECVTCLFGLVLFLCG